MAAADAPPAAAPPAPSIRLLHFADAHLGVESYGRYNPETGLNTRLEDFTQALHQAIDRALEADVDLAVFAGDAYKARDPNQTHQRAFAGALKRLTDAGVPVALLVGNHDIPNTRGRAHALEIYGLLGGGAGVTILQAPRVEPVATRKGAVLVAGMPYLTRSRVLAQDEAKNKTVEEVAHLIRDKYATYLAELAREAAGHPDHLAILTGHFTIADARVGTQGFLLNPNEPQVAVGNVALPAFDYVAMGHIHKPQEMNRGHQPPVVYCGSIDRIDFGERAEQKGFVLADVRKGSATWKHVPLETRRFLDIHADAADAADPTEAIVAEVARHPVAGAIVKLSYKVPPDRVALVRADEIRKALGAAHLVVALSREMPPGEALVRSQVLTESVTPEKALATYLDLQPRLKNRKDELLAHARPLLDALEQEEALR
jgi:exonuclease SbcD